MARIPRPDTDGDGIQDMENSSGTFVVLKTQAPTPSSRHRRGWCRRWFGGYRGTDPNDPEHTGHPVGSAILHSHQRNRSQRLWT